MSRLAISRFVLAALMGALPTLAQAQTRLMLDVWESTDEQIPHLVAKGFVVRGVDGGAMVLQRPEGGTIYLCSNRSGVNMCSRTVTAPK